MKMFGFANEEERNVFLDLLKVEGVGAKGAVKILSNIAISKFVEALDTGNTEVLEAVSGIGKKTAAKIMLTLKGKLSLEDSTKSAHHPEQAEFQDVINSLVDMGYDKRDVTEVVDRITDQLMSAREFLLPTTRRKEACAPSSSTNFWGRKKSRKISRFSYKPRATGKRRLTTSF